MTPEELRKLLDRHEEVRLDLRELHLGRVQSLDVDHQVQERALAEELLAIETQIGEHQFQDQTAASRKAALDPKLRMTELALTFPRMDEGVPGICPWDQLSLNDWAQSGRPSHGERMAAEFLLYVWNPGPETPWAGRFNLEEALKTWDIFHRRAFLRWAEEPFWP